MALAALPFKAFVGRAVQHISIPAHDCTLSDVGLVSFMLAEENVGKMQILPALYRCILVR